jgi:3-oxoacyl-[acyl-carrier protein] reductase
MDLGLAGKVVVVAASSRGMGKATAMAFAAEGARVSMLARTPADLARSAEEIRAATGAELLTMPADVTRAEDIRRAVQATAERWGLIHVLVTNAGGPPPGGFADMEDARWQAAFELNLLSTIRLIREVLPHMRRAGGGAIVTIQSTSVKAPLDNMILSNTIRPGVIGLTKSLSRDLGKERIRVNNVLPGAILTDRQREVMSLLGQRLGKSPEEVRRLREAEIPLGSLGAPEDVANLVVFLASERARYITGATIQVDGGAVRSIL